MSFEAVVVLVGLSIKPLKKVLIFLAGGSHSSSVCSELGSVIVVLMELVLSLVLLCWSSLEIRLAFSSLYSEGVHHLSLNLGSNAEANKNASISSYFEKIQVSDQLLLLNFKEIAAVSFDPISYLLVLIGVNRSCT